MNYLSIVKSVIAWVMMMAVFGTPLTSFMMVAFATPASAEECGAVCGKIWHIDPDNGYDAPFRIRCDFGDPPAEQVYIYEGQNTESKCGGDSDQIYVHYDEQIVCRIMVRGEPYWYIKWDDQGWNKYNDLTAVRCVAQRD